MAEKPEDMNLPASVVARIVKDALPDGVSVSKEAKNSIGRAASIFILYATACANSHAIKGKRKTIAPNDLLQAVEDMEFKEFLPEMRECLEVFKKEQKEKKEAAADRKRNRDAEISVGSSSAAAKDDSSATAVATATDATPLEVQEEEMETQTIEQTKTCTVDDNLTADVL